MDENSRRFAQLIIRLLGIQTAFLTAVIGFMRKHFNDRFDKIDQRFEKVDHRFDKIEEKITDIDRRVCRIEGALSSKDCCMLKDDRIKEKSS